MQIILLRFCHIGTKRSVLWPSKYVKIRFRPELCPGPRWELMTLPRPLIGWGTPSPYPTLLGTNPPSTLALRPPELQPDLRLCPDGNYATFVFLATRFTWERGIPVSNSRCTAPDGRKWAVGRPLSCWLRLNGGSRSGEVNARHLRPSP